MGTQAVSQTAPAVRAHTWAFRSDTERLRESHRAPRGLLWPHQALQAWPGPSTHASSLPAWLCVSRKRRRTNAAKHSQTAMSSPQTCRIRRCLCVQKNSFIFMRNFIKDYTCVYLHSVYVYYLVLIHSELGHLNITIFNINCGFY